MNGYELSRSWFDFSFENPELISPIHGAIFFFAIEHCNRMGWKKKFGFPSRMAMDAIGVKSYHTYIKAFSDLVDWGFFELVKKSKNQYSSNIIALSKYNKALDKALDKAISKHASKHSQSTHQSTNSINKPLTNKQINHKPENKARPKSFEVLKDYFFENIQDIDVAQIEAEKFMDYYESNGWKVGKNPIKDWRACVRSWCKKRNEFKRNGKSKSAATEEQLQFLASRTDI